MNSKKIFFLIMVSFFTQLSYSQDFWEIVPTPDTANPWTITFNNNGDIWSGSNGVYLSQDNGETWEFKGLSGNTIYSVAIDSLDNIFAGASGVIYKSTDYGNSWDFVISGLDNILAIECSKNGLMFAGSGFDVGIIRSIDYGETWDTVFMVPGWEEYIYDIKTGAHNVVYTATTALMGNGGGVYRSVDNGETWDHIGLFNSYVKDLDLDPNGKLYSAVYGHHNTGIGGCYVYDDENSEWAHLTQDLNAMSIIINSNNYVFLGVSNAVGGPGGVYSSMDGGENWQWINSGLAGNTIEKVFLSPDEYVYAITYGINILHRSINPTVSIKDENFNYPIIEVFPVPFSEIFFIKISLDDIYENCFLNIFDINGSVILRKELSNPNSIQTISINGIMWEPGIYIYHLYFDNYSMAGKIIKTKK